MIKWEKEHHQSQEDGKPTLPAEDAANIHLMLGRNIAHLADMENQNVFAIIVGQDELLGNVIYL